MNQPHALDVETSEAALRSMTTWRKPTIEQVRNAALDGRILAPTAADSPREQSYVSSVADAIFQAIKRGLLFDLGYAPNNILISESQRAVQLIAHGHIGHPYREPYVIFHTWSDPRLNGGEIAGSVYFVDPSDWHRMTHGSYRPGSFLVTEAECALVHGQQWLMICDTALACVTVNDAGLISYHGTIQRGALHAGLELQRSDKDVICNLFDPVTASLLLLATHGVTVDRIEPPAKLNKARLAARKPAIPAHWRVNTAPYITALSLRGQHRGPPGAGHHASPVPHLRRGHLRHLHERHGGGTTWVRDALVMLKDGEEQAMAGRSFYQITGENR
jgi:hypothetical protein